MAGPTNKDLQDLLYTLVDQNTQILVENTQIKKSLQDIVRANKNLLEENSKLKTKLEEVNNKLERENINRKEEYQKLFSHFTEKIKQLSTCQENDIKFTPNSFLTLPRFSSPEVIINFDRRIEEDEEMRNKLISQFKTQPHDDVRKFVTDNLKLVFREDEVASQFSWLSANRNISVKDMSFIKLLKDVTEKEIPSTCEPIIEQYIRTFFNLVKDRLNKRNKRKRDPLD